MRNVLVICAAAALAAATQARATQVILSVSANEAAKDVGSVSGSASYNSDGQTLQISPDPTNTVLASGGGVDGSPYDYFVSVTAQSRPYYFDNTKLTGAAASSQASMPSGALHVIANGNIGDVGGGAYTNGKMTDIVTFHNAGLTALPATITWSIDASTSYISGSGWSIDARATFNFLQSSGPTSSLSQGNVVQYGYTRNSNGGDNNTFHFTDDASSDYTPMTLTSDGQGPNASASMTLLIPAGNTTYNFGQSMEIYASFADADYGNTTQFGITIPADDGGLLTYSAPAVLQPVPEPAIALLPAMAAAGLLRRRRLG